MKESSQIAITHAIQIHMQNLQILQKILSSEKQSSLSKHPLIYRNVVPDIPRPRCLD